jgi:ABC-type transporter Mla subunit MlaD
MNPPLPQGRFAGLVSQVNTFLLIALGLALAFVGLVSYKQGWFMHQSPIHFVTGNALGLNKGMPVKLYGFTIGSVSDMKLADGGVDVRLTIVSSYLERIPEDSRARHARESGLVGASVIDILPGKSPRAITEEARIAFEPARGISEIVDDFRRQAVPAFNEIKQAMSHVGRSGEDVTKILAGLRAEVERLPATHRQLQKLVEDASKATADMSRSSVATLQAVERVAGTLDRTLPPLAEKVGSGVASIDAAAVQLRKTGEEAQLTLKGARPLLDHSEAAAREAGDVMSAAKRVWPLSDSFKETSDGMLPIDSFEALGKRTR